MIRSNLLIAGALFCTLPACGSPSPVADEVENSGALPAIVNNSASADGSPPAKGAAPATNDTEEAAPATAIPEALHGRWGLTPADCTSTRGDAKGLLTITADELRFYESRAVPAGNVETSADSISADFAFTGEGMNWTKFQTLQLQNGKLVRTESSPMASFTYARCG